MGTRVFSPSASLSSPIPTEMVLGSHLGAHISARGDAANANLRFFCQHPLETVTDGSWVMAGIFFTALPIDMSIF